MLSFSLIYLLLSCFSFFGFLLIISFIEFNFIIKHFLFLKTIGGKGFFNLFLCAMFIVGNSNGLAGYIMCGCLGAFGLLYMLIACACIRGYEKEMEGDLTKDSVLKGSKTNDDEKLLNSSVKN